jgi:hypothetical protein
MILNEHKIDQDFLKVEAVINISRDPKVADMKYLVHYIKYNQIVTISESFVPECPTPMFSIITLTTGENLMVKEPLNSLLLKIKEY